jgi:hypothetical protein
MHLIPETDRSMNAIGWLVLLFGIAMVVYWVLYLIRQMPTGGVPILSESVTALLALSTGAGLLRRKKWAVPFCFVLAGMWAYGLIGGIALVLQQGLSFESPFGAATDAALFPVILLFDLWMALTVWSNRLKFSSE